MLARLEGSCRTPIAALAEVQGEILIMRGLVATPDGTAVHEACDSAVVTDAVLLGERVAETLLDRAGLGFVIGAG
jgi:hydroxymethylbilane synthase